MLNIANSKRQSEFFKPSIKFNIAPPILYKCRFEPKPTTIYSIQFCVSYVLVPTKVFIIDRLDETEAKNIKVTLEKSAELNWWEFKPLEKLDLSFNAIKIIPDDIRNISDLRVLDVSL